MENDGFVEVEADIERIVRNRSEHERRRHLGRDSSLVAGITYGDDSSEDTPLLGKDAGQIPQTESALDGDAASAWPGQADFDGLPWYRQPSVR